jgi:hypothetical protein
MSGKPQGRKPRCGTEASAGAMSYGDLNGVARPGQLDSGTDAYATAPGDVSVMRLEPDNGDGVVHKRGIPSDMSIGGRFSQLR